VTLTSEPAIHATRFSVEAWSDPVIDQLGHDPRSAYVEKFWLPILGPSSIWLLRRIADGLDRHPSGFDLDLSATAQALGVGMRGGRNSPLLRTFERCCRFGAARMHGSSSVSVRRRLAPLTRSQTERLPDALRVEHGTWLSRPRSSASFEQIQHRARSLALSMLQLGEDHVSIERQLHHWRFHPAVAHEALRWAISHSSMQSADLADCPPGSLLNDDVA